MNTGSSSEILSESIGIKDSIEIASQLGDIWAAWARSAKLIREYIVHSDQVKKLKTGKLFVNDKPNGTVAQVPAWGKSHRIYDKFSEWRLRAGSRLGQKGRIADLRAVANF